MRPASQERIGSRYAAATSNAAMINAKETFSIPDGF